MSSRKPASRLFLVVAFVVGSLGVFLGRNNDATRPPDAGGPPPNVAVFVDFQTWSTNDSGTLAIIDASIQNDSDYAVTNVRISCSFIDAAGAEISSGVQTVSDSVKPRDRRAFTGLNFGRVDQEASSVTCSVLSATKATPDAIRACPIGVPSSGRALVNASEVPMMNGPGVETGRLLNEREIENFQTKSYVDLHPSDDLQALCETNIWMKVKNTGHYDTYTHTGWIEKRFVTRELTEDQKHGLFWDIAHYIKRERSSVERSGVIPADEEWLRRGALKLLSDDNRCKRIDYGSVRPRDSNRYTVSCEGSGNEGDGYDVAFNQADVASGKDLALLAPPQPYSETPSRELCETAIKNKATHPSTVNIHIFGYATRTYGTGLRRVWQTFSAKNGFGLELTYRATYEISPDGKVAIYVEEQK
jgi:hypothetical protein